jgi:ribonucleoside-diphosphate reductase alpha chain
VSFIGLYDAASQVLRSGGRRRAANMAVLAVDHPDIEAFVDAKAQPGSLPTFNLSVAVPTGSCARWRPVVDTPL